MHRLHGTWHLSTSFWTPTHSIVYIKLWAGIVLLWVGWMTGFYSHDAEGFFIFTVTSRMVLSPSQPVIQSVSGTLPWVKSSWSVKLTTYFPVMLRFRMHVLIARCSSTGENWPFTNFRLFGSLESSVKFIGTFVTVLEYLSAFLCLSTSRYSALNEIWCLESPVNFIIQM